MTLETYGAATVKAIVEASLNAAREREAARKKLDAVHDKAKLEALQIGEQLARQWGNEPDTLLVQLRGEPTDAFAAELADLLRPARVFVTKVTLESNPKLPRPTKRTAYFAHIVEPSLLVEPLAHTMQLQVALVKTF